MAPVSKTEAKTNSTLSDSARRWMEMLRLSAARQKHLFYPNKQERFRWEHDRLLDNSTDEKKEAFLDRE